jgi:YD repeat-containing protein
VTITVPASETDPLGRQTSEVLDQYGRALQVTAPDTGITTYVRDSQGWITQETAPDTDDFGQSS